MGLINIFNDIEIKGDKIKTILRWVLGIAGSAIVGAFMIGQLKTNLFNKINNIQALALENKKATIELRTEVRLGFNEMNNKIDDIYSIGIEGFEEYRIFNNQQLEMIIEFGQSNEEVNQELLKRMLRLNSKEKAQQIENQIEASKRGKVSTSKTSTSQYNLPSIAGITNVETGITTYYVNGAHENYLDTLDSSKYKILEKKKSEIYEGLYDFTYIDLFSPYDEY